jgi:hypothetical protein
MTYQTAYHIQSFVRPLWPCRGVAQAVSRRPVTAETRFRSRLVPCVICVGQSGTETMFSPSTSVFPCQFHSTGVPLHVKTEKSNHLYHKVEQLTSRLRCVRSVCCGALHHKKKTVFAAFRLRGESDKVLFMFTVCSPSLFYLFTAGVEVIYFHLITLRHTTQSVGLLWKRDRHVAETSTWQHNSAQDKHPCLRWDSNPRSQEALGRRRKALDRAVTGIGLMFTQQLKVKYKPTAPKGKGNPWIRATAAWLRYVTLHYTTSFYAFLRLNYNAAN